MKKRLKLKLDMEWRKQSILFFSFFSFFSKFQFSSSRILFCILLLFSTIPYYDFIFLYTGLCINFLLLLSIIKKLLKNHFTLKNGNETGLKHYESHSDAKPQYKPKVLDETELVAHAWGNGNSGIWNLEGIKVLHNFFTECVYYCYY